MRARVEAARPHHDQLGPLQRLERPRVGGRRRRVEPHPLALGAVGGERRLAPHLVPVGEPRDELDHLDGARDDTPADGEHAGRLRDRAVEAAEQVRHPGEEQVAEAVPGELAGREPVLEELADQRLVLGQRGQAAPQVARSRHVEVAPQPAGAAAVVGRGDDRGHARHPLQAAQDGGEAGASSEADHTHPAARAAHAASPRRPAAPGSAARPEVTRCRAGASAGGARPGPSRYPPLRAGARSPPPGRGRRSPAMRCPACRASRRRARPRLSRRATIGPAGTIRRATIFVPAEPGTLQKRASTRTSWPSPMYGDPFRVSPSKRV